MIGFIKRQIAGWENGIVVSPDAGGAKRFVILLYDCSTFGVMLLTYLRLF